jgi:hypothetical protein
MYDVDPRPYPTVIREMIRHAAHGFCSGPLFPLVFGGMASQNREMAVKPFSFVAPVFQPARMGTVLLVAAGVIV